MLSLSGGSSSLLPFQFSEMTFMAQTLSSTCLSWDRRFCPHPSKLHVVGCTQTKANSSSRGWSLSTCCRQELCHLLWSSPAFCNRLTYIQITCKLYLSRFPAWKSYLSRFPASLSCSSTGGRSRPERCQSAELGKWRGPSSGAPASCCWRAAGFCMASLPGLQPPNWGCQGLLPALPLDLSGNRNHQVWGKVRPLGVSGGQSGQYLRQSWGLQRSQTKRTFLVSSAWVWGPPPVCVTIRADAKHEHRLWAGFGEERPLPAPGSTCKVALRPTILKNLTKLPLVWNMCQSQRVIFVLSILWQEPQVWPEPGARHLMKS